MFADIFGSLNENAFFHNYYSIVHFHFGTRRNFFRWCNHAKKCKFCRYFLSKNIMHSHLHFLSHIWSQCWSIWVANKIFCCSFMIQTWNLCKNREKRNHFAMHLQVRNLWSWNLFSFDLIICITKMEFFEICWNERLKVIQNITREKLNKFPCVTLFLIHFNKHPDEFLLQDVVEKDQMMQ